MDRCWILVGMMGSGKSAVGRALATLANREFVDTDVLLQNRFGRPVSQIFQVYGEEAFRAHETSVLRSLSPAPIVLATGGGIVLSDDNWAEMRRLGVTIFLRASVETLLDRLERSKKRRPLLEVEDWQERAKNILTQRLPRYELADIIVPVDDNEIDDAGQSVLRAIHTFESHGHQP